MFVSLKKTIAKKHIHKGNGIVVNVKISWMDFVGGGDQFQQQAI